MSTHGALSLLRRAAGQTSAVLRDRRLLVLAVAGLAAMAFYFKVREWTWPTIDRDLGDGGAMGLTFIAAGLIFGILVDLLWPNGFGAGPRTR